MEYISLLSMEWNPIFSVAISRITGMLSSASTSSHTYYLRSKRESQLEQIEIRPWSQRLLLRIDMASHCLMEVLVKAGCCIKMKSLFLEVAKQFIIIVATALEYLSSFGVLMKLEGFAVKVTSCYPFTLLLYCLLSGLYSFSAWESYCQCKGNIWEIISLFSTQQIEIPCQCQFPSTLHCDVAHIDAQVYPQLIHFTFEFLLCGLATTHQPFSKPNAPPFHFCHLHEGSFPFPLLLGLGKILLYLLISSSYRWLL